MFEEIRILRTLRRQEDHFVDEKTILKALNRLKAMKEGPRKTKLVQTIFYTEDLVEWWHMQDFKKDFDITPYLKSDEIAQEVNSMPISKIIEKIDYIGNENSYIRHFILANLEIPRLKELLAERPNYIFDVFREEREQLFTELFTSDLTETQIRFLSWEIQRVGFSKEVLDNEVLLKRFIKESPNSIRLLEDETIYNMDDYYLELAKEDYHVLFGYTGNVPKIQEAQLEILSENFVESCTKAYACHGSDIFMKAFKNAFSQNHEIIYEIPMEIILIYPEIFQTIVSSGYKISFDKIKESEYFQTLCSDNSYREKHMEYLIKQDARFFKLISPDTYYNSKNINELAMETVNRNFSVMQYIKLSYDDDYGFDKDFDRIISRKLREDITNIKYLSSYLHSSVLLKKLKEYIEEDFSAVQYLTRETEGKIEEDSKASRRYDQIVQLILDGIQLDISNSRYYKGTNTEILCYIVENGGQISDDQIRYSDYSDGEENIIVTKVIPERIKKENPNLSDERIRLLLKYLLANNAEIIKTTDFRIFNEKYINIFRYNEVFRKSVIKTVLRYKDLQELIITKIDSLENSELLVEIIRNNLVRMPNNLSITVQLLKNLSDQSYVGVYNLAVKALQNNPDKKDKIISNITYYLAGNINHFKINSEEEIINLEEVVDKKSREVIQNIDNESLKSVQEALLLEKFGLSFLTAYLIVNKYSYMKATEPNLTEEEVKLITILEALKMIVECKSKEKLAIIYSTINHQCELRIDEVLVLDQKLRQMNTRHLNMSLTPVEEMKDTHLEATHGVKIYEALDEDNPHEFKMVVTSLGAYSRTEVPENYRSDWLRPNETSHSFCTSLISNQLLGIAQIKHAVLGFTDIPLDNLLLSAPYDIGSDTSLIDVVSGHDNTQFFFPDEMIDQTRHTHNEMVIERVNGETKVYPSFVVFTAEHFSPQGLYIGEEKKLWENALQAAKDLGVPIVVLDRSKIKKYEKAQIQKMLQEFQKGGPMCHTLIVPIITRMINNITGYDNVNRWNKSGFLPQDLDTLIDTMLNSIIDMVNNKQVEEALKCIQKMLSCFECEDKKDVNFDMTTHTKKIYSAIATIKQMLKSDTESLVLLEQLGGNRDGKKI